MSKVSIRVNDRAFSIGCEPGQEAHVQSLGENFDKKVGELVKQVGQIGDLRLFLMAALVLSDELATAQSEADTTNPQETIRQAQDDASNAINAAAERVEQILTQLEAVK